MELRSYNVERVYAECVKCRIGDEIGINSEALKNNEGNIRSMLSQVYTLDGTAPLALCHTRTDGEVWTPYLQIVEMIILLGEKIGGVSFTRPLNETTQIRFLCQN